jgi:hypothetical protein
MLLRIVNRDRPLEMRLGPDDLPGPEARFSRAMMGAREEIRILQIFRKPKGLLARGAELPPLNVDLEEVRHDWTQLAARSKLLTEIARSLEGMFPLGSTKALAGDQDPG